MIGIVVELGAAISAVQQPCKHIPCSKNEIGGVLDGVHQTAEQLKTYRGYIDEITAALVRIEEKRPECKDAPGVCGGICLSVLGH